MTASELAEMFVSPSFYSGLVTGALASKAAKRVVTSRLRGSTSSSSSTSSS